MQRELPLKVLGLLGPILSWVEGAEGLRLPGRWRNTQLRGEDRERAWLMHELPTFSHDTLDEIIKGARRPWQDDVPLSFEATQKLRGKSDEWMTSPEGYELAEVFETLSQRYFEWTGNELAILGDRIGELHELALRFPLRHLIQHSYARGVASGVLAHDRALELPDRLNSLHSSSRGLRATVSRGLTEGHLHLWGVPSAETAWSDHLLGKPSRDSFREFAPEQARLLVLSRVAVRLLALGALYAAFDLELDSPPPPQTRTQREEPWIAPSSVIAYLDRLYHAPVNAGASLMQEDLLDVMRRLVKQVSDRLVSMDGDRRQEVSWLLRLIDPIAHRLWQRRNSDLIHEAAETHGVASRMKLLARLHLRIQLLLIRRTPDRNYDNSDQDTLPAEVLLGPRDDLLHFLQEVFFRYLVYHTHSWQTAVQNGKTTGLRQFSKFYGSHQREVQTSEMVRRGLILQELAGSEGLRALEARLSPPRSGVADLASWILAAGEAHRHGELEKFGLVVHFKKSDHRTTRQRESRVGFPVLRHGRRRWLVRERAFALFRQLSTVHPVVPFIVGIDAASYELTTPPEVFAPAFRFLREHPIELRRGSRAGRWSKIFPVVAELVKGRRLGMTYHVGEDFRHLLSGLRAIHEAMEFLKPRPGDRLGHALALALDPDVWAAHIGYQAVLPKLEWLDTLVWLHHFMGPGHGLVGRLGLEDDIQRLSRRIYEPMDLNNHKRKIPKLDRSPQILHESWRLRQLDPRSLDASALVEGRYQKKELMLPGPHHRRWSRVQYKVGQTLDEQVGSRDAYRLLSLYWFDERVQRQGETVIDVDMKRRKGLWLELCREAQEKLIRQVTRRQLVIEANPTSNRVIGPMPSLREHPIFRLTLDDQNRLWRRVRVTVNTDDPGVFETSLAHEYYLLAEDLLERGAPEAEVVTWLEWLRKNGEEYSFLHSLATLDDPRIQELLESLEGGYKHILSQLNGRQRNLRWRLQRQAAKSRETPERQAIRRLERELESERESRRLEIAQLREALYKFKDERNKGP